jgi:hypothetical protein
MQELIDQAVDLLRSQLEHNIALGAVKIAEEFGPVDGAHHKTWVIDQMVRVLLGEAYDMWVVMRDGWDEGIAP